MDLCVTGDCANDYDVLSHGLHVTVDDSAISRALLHDVMHSPPPKTLSPVSLLSLER